MSDPVSAIRALPRFTYLSREDARGAVIAVLRSVREPVMSVMAVRRAAYQRKANGCDPLADDSYNRHDAMTIAAEAMDWASHEVAAAIDALVAEIEGEAK